MLPWDCLKLKIDSKYSVLMNDASKLLEKTMLDKYPTLTINKSSHIR